MKIKKLNYKKIKKIKKINLNHNCRYNKFIEEINRCSKQKKRLSIVIKYWNKIFISLININRYNYDVLFLRISYELQYKMNKDEGRSISKKLLDRLKSSRNMDCNVFDSDFKEIYLLANKTKDIKMTISKKDITPVITKKRNTIGVTSKKSRPEFLIKIFKSNYKEKKTDNELIHILHNEFPQLKDVEEKDLRVFRSYYNKGKLKTQDVDNPPKRFLNAFDSEGNKIAPLRRGRKIVKNS